MCLLWWVEKRHTKDVTLAHLTLPAAEYARQGDKYHFVRLMAIMSEHDIFVVALAHYPPSI